MNSHAVKPAASITAADDPAEVPAIASNDTPASSRARAAPEYTAPLTPPPSRTSVRNRVAQGAEGEVGVGGVAPSVEDGWWRMARRRRSDRAQSEGIIIITT